MGVRSGLSTAGLLGPPEESATDADQAPAPPPAPVAPTTTDDGPDGEDWSDATDRKPVVFFHVMKCGGTSVRVGLSDGHHRAREGPEVFELDGEAAKLSAGGSDRDNWKFRDALLPYVLRAMRPPVVLGHFRYRDAYQDLMDDAHFVTVLRTRSTGWSRCTSTGSTRRASTSP